MEHGSFFHGAKQEDSAGLFFREARRMVVVHDDGDDGHPFFFAVLTAWCRSWYRRDALLMGQSSMGASGLSGDGRALGHGRSWGVHAWCWRAFCCATAQRIGMLQGRARGDGEVVVQAEALCASGAGLGGHSSGRQNLHPARKSCTKRAAGRQECPKILHPKFSDRTRFLAGVQDSRRARLYSKTFSSFR